MVLRPPFPSPPTTGSQRGQLNYPLSAPSTTLRDPPMPSEYSPCSWPFPQSKRLAEQSCATSLRWGLPGRAEASHTAWSLPQGRAMPPLRQGVPPGRAVSPGSDGDPPAQSTLPGPAPAGSEHLASVAPSPMRWWPGCAVYPSTFLTAPSSRTPSGTRPGRSREQRAWGWLVLGACSGLSPTLCWEICPLGN